MKNKYSVSLLFTKTDGVNLKSALRVMILDASNKNEALGEAFNDISSQPDLKDFQLGLHVVVKIDC